MRGRVFPMGTVVKNVYKPFKEIDWSASVRNDAGFLLYLGAYLTPKDAREALWRHVTRFLVKNAAMRLGGGP